MADCAGFSKSPTEYGRQVQFYTMEVLGAGSVVQRDKSKPRGRCRKWELSVRVVENGRKTTRTHPFEGTYTNACKAKEDFVAELRAMPDPDKMDKGMTTPQWAREWHRRRVRSRTLAESTLRGDRQKINVVDMHLDCPIADVTADMIVDVYWEMAEGNTPSGRKWADSSIEDLHKAFVGMFGMAVKRHVIASNPMDDVPAPKGGDSREWAAPPQNVDYLLEYLDYSSGVQRAVALQAACGLRLSESVSIEWPDLTDVAFVRKSKTDAGKNRVVPMPERVLARLEPHRRTTGAVSGGVRADSVRRWVTRHAVEMFVPGATPHGLRHSFCTRLAKAKVHPRVMMELMGHASMDVCMRIYTHVNNDDKIAAIRDAFG